MCGLRIAMLDRMYRIDGSPLFGVVPVDDLYQILVSRRRSASMYHSGRGTRSILLSPVVDVLRRWIRLRNP